MGNVYLSNKRIKVICKFCDAADRDQAGTEISKKAASGSCGCKPGAYFCPMLTTGQYNSVKDYFI